MIGKKNIYQTKLGLRKLTIQKNIRMQQKKNTIHGTINYLILLILFLNVSSSFAQENSNKLDKVLVEMNVLDKVSSKNTILKFKLNEEKKFQNLLIKVLKCENSKFDDDPEITAYIQVKDLNVSDNEKVFIFNGWTFSSSPTLNPFDHPVYDLWLSSCKII